MLNDTQDFFNQFDYKDITSKWLESSRLALQVKNGNVPKWSSALDSIQCDRKGVAIVSKPHICIKDAIVDQVSLVQGLSLLMPWRKGPFLIKNVALESEWQGDMKWSRLEPHISSLKGKKVLDVGAGNGYFTLRMSLEGASLALGVEPFLLFNYQFKAIKSLISNCQTAHILPIRLEQMAPKAIFDSVFSMGVLYHQKDHMLHLKQLKSMMAPGAELVIETLVIDGPAGYALIPESRYARMRNVHCLPSIGTLELWLKEAGFTQIKTVNTCKTSIEEQRRTKWIGENSASLEDFLDPTNKDLTIEGHPAPKRVIVIAKK